MKKFYQVYIYELPLSNLGIGKRLKWFDDHMLKNDYLLFL